MAYYQTPSRIKASVVIDDDLKIAALPDQEITKFAQSKLTRDLAEEILKREDIFSRKETWKGVTFSAEFYCLTGEQLNQIVQANTVQVAHAVTQDIGYRVL